MWESANLVADQLLASAAAATLVLAFVSVCRAAASAAAAILVFAVASDCRAASDAAVTSARHVCCDCASF